MKQSFKGSDSRKMGRGGVRGGGMEGREYFASIDK